MARSCFLLPCGLAINVGRCWCGVCAMCIGVLRPDRWLLYVSGSDLTVPLLAMGGPSTNHPLSTFIWSVLLAHRGMLRLQTARAVAAHRRDSAAGSPRGDCWWCDLVVVVV